MASDEPAKRTVKADPRRLMAWMDGALETRPFQLGLLGLLFLVLALLLGPRLWGRDGIAADMRVGTRAEGNIKATRSFDYYPTEEKIETERAAAAESILPVFDHHTDFSASLLSRIGRAFNAMVAIDAGTGEQTGRPSPEQLEERRDRFANLLQTEVPPPAFSLLQKANFSTEVRASLLTLVGTAMSQPIVAHRGALVPFENTPLTVRHLVGGRTGAGGEEKLTNLGRIKDLQQVRDEVRLQAPVHAAKLSQGLSDAVVSLAQNLVVPNMAFNQEETEKRREVARALIEARPVSLVKGQVIVRDGDPITKEHLSIVRAMESSQKGADVVQVVLGIGLSVLLALVMIFRYARRQFRRFLHRPRDVLAMSVLLVGILALTKFAIATGAANLGPGRELPLILYAIPVAGGAMLVQLLISAEAAALFAVVLGVLCGMVAEQSLGMTVFYMVTGLVGAAGVTQVQSRSTILRAGLWAGLVGAVLVLGFRMFREQLLAMDTLYAIMAALAGGMLASFVTLALLPAMEWLFAYTTDVSLLELANLNHPLMREMILRAPGTYHHSMIVGSLSEAACEAIGANGLLARVACYYHDIGKIKNADYFAENFKPGDNPHNRLKPSMSALIIRSHVKDTIEMLRERGIPELVIETATQHHGKTLIEFFFHKAKETKEADEDIHEEDYRYPGPKPQSREAGVIMLADGVEAAARSLAEPTEDRLTAVVQRVINTKFTDGQLDHCDLTLRDLHLIAKSFLQVLRGIYHQRPTYPWQQGKREDPRRTVDEARKDTTRSHRTQELSAELEKLDKTVERGDRTDKGERADRTDKGERGDKGDKTGKAAAKLPVKQQAKNDKKGKPESRPDKKGKAAERTPTGAHVAVKENGGRSAAEERKPSGGDEQQPDQPAGEGSGAEDAGFEVTSETAQASNPDIKRLGLS